MRANDVVVIDGVDVGDDLVRVDPSLTGVDITVRDDTPTATYLTLNAELGLDVDVEVVIDGMPLVDRYRISSYLGVGPKITYELDSLDC